MPTENLGSHWQSIQVPYYNREQSKLDQSFEKADSSNDLSQFSITNNEEHSGETITFPRIDAKRTSVLDKFQKGINEKLKEYQKELLN